MLQVEMVKDILVSIKIQLLTKLLHGEMSWE